MLTAELDALDYHPVAFNAAENPYPTYRLLRDEAPVFRSPRRDLWVLSRFEDVQAAARDWETFSNLQGVHVGSYDGPFGRSALLSTDPPLHDALRDIVRRRFTPKSVEGLGAAIRLKADAIVDDLLERREVDLASDFGWRLPVEVAAEMLGLPAADVPYLREVLGRMESAGGHIAEHLVGYDVPESAWTAVGSFHTYFEAQLTDRRSHPREDPLTDIALAEANGDLDIEARKGLCLLLLAAGIDTTSSLISNSLYHLVDLVDERAFFAMEPPGAANAVEELLRFDSPVQSHTRITTRDVELYDEVIPRGATIVLLYGSANRDERRWPDAAQLNLAREPQRNLAFGVGIHFCLGAPVARLEARIALAAFFRRIRTYEFRGPVTRSRTDTDRGIVRLPAEVTG